MNHSLCLAGYGCKRCELLKCCVEHTSYSLLFIYVFNKTNKERVALEVHLINFLHGPVPRHLCSCPSLYPEVDTHPLLIPFGSRPWLGDGILPLIKRCCVGLSPVWPQSPSRGCTVTGNTHHLRASLILSPQDSKMCLPHWGVVLQPPLCQGSPSQHRSQNWAVVTSGSTDGL